MFFNVACGVLEHNNKILLIKRHKMPFKNMWALPGGKIEENEHIDEAAVREIFEETGLETTFENLLGTASEVITSFANGEEKAAAITTTFLYICKLKIKNFKNTESEILKWFDKNEIQQGNNIVGSDIIFLNEFYFNKTSNLIKINCTHTKENCYSWKKV